MAQASCDLLRAPRWRDVSKEFQFTGPAVIAVVDTTQTGGFKRPFLFKFHDGFQVLADSLRGHGYQVGLSLLGYDDTIRVAMMRSDSFRLARTGGQIGYYILAPGRPPSFVPGPVELSELERVLRTVLGPRDRENPPVGAPADRPAPDESMFAVLRRSFPDAFARETLIEQRWAEYHGRHLIFIVSSALLGSNRTFYTLWAVNDSMTHPERLADLQVPWPDYRPGLERITPESVYVTGRSASYRRELHRAYVWWPPERVRERSRGPRLPLSSIAPLRCADTLRVDLYHHTIAGISMEQAMGVIEREVGGGIAIRRDTLWLCGHVVKLFTGGVAWTDPAFRTAEGLGIGSTLASFDTAYGPGEPTLEEGESVRYYPPDGLSHFFLDVESACYAVTARPIQVDRTCRVSGISFLRLYGLIGKGAER